MNVSVDIHSPEVEVAYPLIDATPAMFDVAMQVPELSVDAIRYLTFLKEASFEDREYAMQLDELFFATIGGLFKKVDFADRREILKHYNSAVQKGIELSGDYAMAYTSMGCDMSNFGIDVEAYLSEVDERVQQMKAEEVARVQAELKAIGMAILNAKDLGTLQAMLSKALLLGAEMELIQRIMVQMEAMSSPEHPVKLSGLAYLATTQPRATQDFLVA